MKVYGLYTDYDSMRLIKNLAVLIEYADILSAKFPDTILIPMLNTDDLKAAEKQVAPKIDLSKASWTAQSAIGREIGITKNTTADGEIALTEYIALLRISLEKALASICNDPVPVEKGLFDILKDLAKPEERTFLAKDIERITDMYIPDYIDLSHNKTAAPAKPPVQTNASSAYTVGQQIRFMFKDDILSGTITAIEPMVSGKDYKLTINVAELGQTKKYSENTLKVLS